MQGEGSRLLFAADTSRVGGVYSDQMHHGREDEECPGEVVICGKSIDVNTATLELRWVGEITAWTLRQLPVLVNLLTACAYM
jgi:hypothetical protein